MRVVVWSRHRLRTTFELAADLLIDPSLLAGGVDPELVFRRGVVTAMAGIANDAIEHIAEECLHGGNDVGQRMPVVRVARAVSYTHLTLPTKREV